MAENEEVEFEGDELSIEDAISQIAEALECAKNPLIAGLENLSIQSQRAAMKLAMQCRATVDSSSDNSGRGNTFAFQKRGRVTATLGEVSSRSNLVLFWYCDPAFILPEVFEHLHIDGERIVVNSLRTETEKYSTELIEIPQELAVDALWTLRALVEGRQLDRKRLARENKLSIEKLESLAISLKKSTYGTIVWGSDENDPQFDIQADGIHSLIRSLNSHTRFVGLPFRTDQNGLSAENVSTWTTGFPFAVNLNRGCARQHWLEYSDQLVSNRDEWDVLVAFESGCLTVAAKPLRGRSAFQMEIPTGALGDTESGDACRLDDVLVKFNAAHTSEFLGSEKMIELIIGQLNSKPA